MSIPNLGTHKWNGMPISDGRAASTVCMVHGLSYGLRQNR